LIPLVTLDHLLEVAVATALEAGAVLLSGYRKPKTITYKGEINLVTQYDLASEKVILERLTQAFPDHLVVTEESGAMGRHSPFKWYVDPLDGTTNFAHDYPCFCVSIACEETTSDGPRLVAGVIYDPVRDELFTAGLGRKAFLNGRRISVTQQDDLGKALVSTGFPYYIHERPEPVLSRFGRMCRIAQGVRRAGAAALDLAYLACGRCDGFWEEGLWPWDTAAGVLLVAEAGGTVTDFQGGPFNPEMKEVLASNGHVHYNMITILNPDWRDRKAIWSDGRKGLFNEKNPDQ
jgi:myo-inositol-1(or 4)-monophosphatase